MLLFLLKQKFSVHSSTLFYATASWSAAFESKQAYNWWYKWGVLWKSIVFIVLHDGKQININSQYCLE